MKTPVEPDEEILASQLISNTDDVIDSRDIIKRIEELELDE